MASRPAHADRVGEAVDATIARARTAVMQLLEREPNASVELTGLQQVEVRGSRAATQNGDSLPWNGKVSLV